MLLLCLELLEQKLYLTLWRLSHAIMGLHLTCLLLSLILRYFPRIFTRQNLTRLASTFTSIHSKTNFANSHFNNPTFLTLNSPIILFHHMIISPQWYRVQRRFGTGTKPPLHTLLSHYVKERQFERYHTSATKNSTV